MEAEALDRIVDEIGIYATKQQMEDFFLYREENYKQKALWQREQILAEQERIRYRWKEKNT